MHRTVSLDCGVVVDGTTELVLDSGEKKVHTEKGRCICPARNDSCVAEPHGSNGKWWPAENLFRLSTYRRSAGRREDSGD